MKDTFKILRSFVYICIVLGTLFGCTEERDFIDKNNGVIRKQIPFKELVKQQSFNSAYEKVKQDKQDKSMFRTAIEDEYNFTIVEGKDVKVNEVDNKTFYNILIERDSVSATYFENLLLMVEKIDNVDEVSAYITKYITPNDSLNLDPNNDKELTTLFSRYTNICNTVCVPICITSGGGYNDYHIAESVCTVDHYDCFKVCRDINVGGETTGPNVDSPTGTSGGGTSPSNGTGGSTPDLNGQYDNTPPELLVDPVLEDELPCPGDPVKNPKVCPTESGSKKGGRFGCTRGGKNNCNGLYIGNSPKKHEGIDIALKQNSKLFAMFSGVVYKVEKNIPINTRGNNNGNGNFIRIRSVINGETIEFTMIHLNEVSVNEGQQVSQGQYIGKSGKTGNASARGVNPHVHIQAAKINSNGTKSVRNIEDYLNTKFDNSHNPIPNNCN